MNALEALQTILTDGAHNGTAVLPKDVAEAYVRVRAVLDRMKQARGMLIGKDRSPVCARNILDAAIAMLERPL